MGRFPRVVSLAVALSGSVACGDPLVVFGDRPGILRIVAGVPETPGSTLDSLATRTRLDNPQGLAAGGDGSLYISDHQNARVLAVRPSGRVELILDAGTPGATGFGRPGGLALDGDLRLVVADPLSHRVWSVDLVARDVTPLAGTGRRGTSPDGTAGLSADIDTPTGVAAGGDGRILFSELLGARVRSLETDGTLATVAGTGSTGFSGDGGPATGAQVSSPAGLAVFGRTVYIADSGNHRVRAVDLDAATITTVAGNGTGAFGGDDGPATAAMIRRPLALTFSSDGLNLLIADAGNHRVRLVNLETSVITTFAGTGDETFGGDQQQAGVTALSRPAGVAASPADFLFIADTGHHIVWRTGIRFLTLAVTTP